MTHKHIFLIAIAALAAIASCKSNSPQDVGMRDGEWAGYGEGKNGTIVVRTNVIGGLITSIRVVAQCESAFAQPCFDKIISAVIQRQGYADMTLDATTGATFTSQGTVDAVNCSIDAAYGKIRETTKYSDCSCDVLVIGAGGAGLCAAIAASEDSAQVIVVEKEGIIGGNTNLSTGGINAAWTSIQKENGITDSVEGFYTDTYEGGHRQGYPELIRSFVEHSAGTIDWLTEHKVDLRDVGMMAGSSVKRTHRPKGGAAIGTHLMKKLHAAASQDKVEIRLKNKVTALLSNGERVTGATIQAADGSTYRIDAKAVVIATGGFGANLEMVQQYDSDLKGFITLNHGGATGDAFEWVKNLGGQLVQMENIQIHPTAETGSRMMITEAVRGNGAILLSSEGKRFINEMLTRDIVSAAILACEGGSAYLVFDSAVRKSLSSIETYINMGIIAECESIGALAAATGMPEATLAESIKKYNAAQAAGLDGEFGREAAEMPRPIASLPYYAVRVAPAIHHTMGGVRVDASTRVLRADDTPIPGLFAAGEVTGGLHGGNRLGGNGVGDVVVNGKIAGEMAASQAKDTK